METLLRIGLPIYMVVFTLTAVVFKGIGIARRIGKNPIIVRKDDSAHGIVSTYFALGSLFLIGAVLLYVWYPQWRPWFGEIPFLERNWIQYLGIFLLLAVLPWVMIAQAQMKESWRMGIDVDVNGPLATAGLFSMSRNPIFLGVIVLEIGLFLLIPTLVTFFFLVLGYVLIQVQVRLEEAFLSQKYGDIYNQYRKKVRRWL